MKKFLVLVFAAILAGACSRQEAKKSAPSPSASAVAVTGPLTPVELKAFTALEPIDTHSHIFVTNQDFIAMIEKLNVHTLDIAVDDNTDPYQKDLPREIQDASRYVAASQGHSVFCTTFDPYLFQKPGFAQAAIRQINRDFTGGAIAVKIWKNIGMQIHDAHGNYIMPDNPIFEPIYKDIAAHHKTLVAHVADPSSCWEPPNPASPDFGYYKHSPQWYMYNNPHAPSKETILKARDHVVEENPNLRVVGAHLGSMEANFPELGRDLDRYPNFAVDMAARMPYVMMLPRAQAIDFINKYQDRLIYGTDLDFLPGANPQETIKEWEDYYARDWRFLATNDWVEYRGKKYQGLDLAQPVLEKLYHANAVRWFPGIMGEKH
ncbi:MAG TPA: amidohydrolase family protein [Terriglobia bacterium]|nr:amidohydrolase family protein [Terriglobia bacterium]